ncbi:MAG: hypothetical protein EOP34_02940 [Rickettsiales bacterium]|nr:MAG: hypothetical protein EOP34_02940 [Rickettsiales bacterium]
MFTTLYSVKVLYLTFLTNPNGPQSSYKLAHEGDIYMSLPLIILAIFSIVFGYITKDLFIGLGSDIFSDNSIFIHPNHEITLDTEFAVPVLFKLLPLIFTLSLSLIYIIFSEFTILHANTLITFKFSRFGYNFYSFFNQRFLIEAFYNKFITDFVLKIGGITTKVIDKGLIELIGPYGLEKGLQSLSQIFEALSTKRLTTYALYILVGIVCYLTCSYGLDLETSLNLMFIIPLIMNNKSLSYSKSHFSTCSVLHMDSSDNNSDNNSDSDTSTVSRRSEYESNSDSGFGSYGGRTPEGERMDAEDGLRIDDSNRIANHCENRYQLDHYFNQKEESMTIAFGEGRNIYPDREHLENIEYLKQQKYDVLDQKG